MRFLAFIFLLCPFSLVAQNKVGINTTSPIGDLDVRGTDDVSDGGELQLATPTMTNFIRMFGGRMAEPHPFLAFSDLDTFHFVTTSANWVTFARRMTITPSGNIGIGIDRPLAKLDIKALGDGAELLRFTTDRPWVVKQTGTGISTALTFQPTTNDKAMQILSENGANLAARFFTNNSFSKVSLVPDAGEVGIGILEATAKLHVLGNSTTSNPLLRLTESSATDFARIKLENANEPEIFWDIAALADSSATLSKINFYYGNPGFTGDKMTITGEGNVGIGTTSPGNRLRVNGSSSSSQHVFSAGTNYSGNVHIRAIEGFSTPAVGYGIAGFFYGGYKGIDAEANGGAATGTVTGIEATATGTAGTRIGVYGAALGGTTNWAGYFAEGNVRMSNNLYVMGNTGIGTTAPATALDVNGKIKIADDPDAPQAGMIRWNSTLQDFEGYNGAAWVSFTKQDLTNGWGNATVYAHQNSSSSNSSFDFGARMGSNVYLNGNYAIVGLPRSSMNSPSEGQANIYFFNGTDWVLQKQLEPADGNTEDLFGSSVSISNSYAVIGAPARDNAGISNRGKVYVYERNGADWVLQDELFASDPMANDSFGYSVALNGIDLIVGAPYKDVGGNVNQGKVYFYEYDGSNWVSAGSSTASDGTSDDLYGYSVSVHNGYAIAGAKDAGSTGEGKAYILQWNGSWVQQAILPGPVGAIGVGSGASVSISGEYAAVGTEGNLAISAEKAYIHKRNGTTWTQQAALDSPDEASNTNFGASVSIEGSFLAVGAPNSPFGGGLNTGKSFIFERNGTVWSPKAVFMASDAQPDDQFGHSVSVSGNKVVVGAPFWNSGNQGKVYFFQNN